MYSNILTLFFDFTLAEVGFDNHRFLLYSNFVCQKPLFAVNVFLKIQSWLVMAKQTIKYMADLMYLGGKPQKVSKHVCLMHTGWVSCHCGELVKSINWSPLCHLSYTGIRHIMLGASKVKVNTMLCSPDVSRHTAASHTPGFKAPYVHKLCLNFSTSRWVAWYCECQDWLQIQEGLGDRGVEKCDYKDLDGVMISWSDRHREWARRHLELGLYLVRRHLLLQIHRA